MTQRIVLVINPGSSFVKYQSVDPDSGAPFASGLVGHIGRGTDVIIHKYGEERTEITELVLDHGFGLSGVLRLSEEQDPSLVDAHIVTVGRRVVQGGCYFSGPALIDDDVVARVEQLVSPGPLCNPTHLKGIEMGRRPLSDMPHVAVFDIVFLQDLSEGAARYILDREVANTYSIHRCGAHGTSHQFVSEAVSELLGCGDLKRVVLHLGNGVLVSAVAVGHAVDTSMGLTLLEGLVMSGHTGDIDLAAIFHLVRMAGMSIGEIGYLFNRGSGMKGLAGDNDMREVWKRIDAGEQEAREAMDIYLHRLVKYADAYAAVMDGLDALTFTAGTGGNDANLRRELGERLGFMSVRINQEVSETRSDESCVILIPDLKVAVLVVSTNKELVIAHQALTLT